MTTYQLHLNSETTHMPETESGKPKSGQQAENTIHKLRLHDRPLALFMLGYFLGLGSIAVMVIGGQFPWFTLAPLTILALVMYFRHLEATYEQQSSN